MTELTDLMEHRNRQTHPHLVESAMKLNFRKRPSTKSPSIDLMALGLTIPHCSADKKRNTSKNYTK